MCDTSCHGTVYSYYATSSDCPGTTLISEFDECLHEETLHESMEIGEASTSYIESCESKEFTWNGVSYEHIEIREAIIMIVIGSLILVAGCCCVVIVWCAVNATWND